MEADFILSRLSKRDTAQTNRPSVGAVVVERSRASSRQEDGPRGPRFESRRRCLSQSFFGGPNVREASARHRNDPYRHVLFSGGISETLQRPISMRSFSGGISESNDPYRRALSREASGRATTHFDESGRVAFGHQGRWR